MSHLRQPSQLALDLSHPGGHFEALHAAQHGVVLLWEKLAPTRRWTKLTPGDPEIPAILAAQLGERDRFLSVNEFFAWRLVRHLKSLRAVYLDLDGCTDIEYALQVLAEAGMPAPSCVVFSGNGLHLYWLLEPLPPRALPVWQAVTDALCRAMAKVGADASAKDCTRVLRIPGTINSKHGADHEVRGLILTGARWTLHELADEVLGPRSSPKPKAEVRDLGAARARKGLRAPAGSVYARWHAVYVDLCAIADWYIMGGIPEGSRDKWLFLTATALSWFTVPESLERELLHAARQWTPHLPMTDVLGALQPVLQRAKKAAAGEVVYWGGMEVDPRFRFRRQTLYDWLAPVIPPEIASSLRAIVPDTVAADRKKARDAARSTDHYSGEGYRVGNADKVAAARRMAAEGRSQRAIAGALGVSQPTVKKWLTGGDN